MILEMREITKQFPGVKALDNVTLQVEKGEIHALVGENGAGKSTLVKVLSGFYPHKSYNGQVFIKGKEMKFINTRNSEEAGIAIIYQELELIEELSIAENIFLGNLHNNHGIVKWDEVYYKAGELLKEFELEVDLSKKIKDIGIGQQQLVEIVKALSLNADILILDEPTAALTESEISLLMKILSQLKNRGVTCILISHKLNEVFEIADRVTVLRDGASIGTQIVKDVNEGQIIKMMVGRELTNRYPKKECKIGKIVFEVKNFTKYILGDRSKKLVSNINFSIRMGEIVGISGLMGSGRTELLMSLFGFLKGDIEGTIWLEGKEIKISNPKDAINYGLGIVSEDRKKYGLIHIDNVVKNTTLASLEKVSNYGLINGDQEIHETNQYVRNLGIKTPTVESIIDTLSGGNQQKVLLARCLMTKPKVLFLDEPTRGIDVGAKYEIYTLMNQLAARGAAIIMVSSEMPEIIGMSDRILVMHEGKIAGKFSKDEVTQEKIMIKAAGGSKNEA